MHPSKSSSDDDAQWIQLYDTQTNGNTITYLQFRYDPNGLLQGISKSDDQKLRVWDISYEQHEGNEKNPFFKKQSVIQKFATQQKKHPAKTRPKRPPFCDVTQSEATLAVCGGFSICCGGTTMYNQMSIVDTFDPLSPFNHTELALPAGSGGAGGDVLRSSRRQQRGELHSVVSVAGSVMDPEYVLLEVSDGSIIQYSHGGDGQPKVEMASLSGLDMLPQLEGISRKFCVGKIGSAGVVTTAIATYNSNNGRGKIILRPLNVEVLAASPDGTRPKGFWGFSPYFCSIHKKKIKAPPAAASAAVSNKPIATTDTAKNSLNSSTNIESPKAATDISKWTHPPSSAVCDRMSLAASTPGQASTSVQLFGSERDDHSGTPTVPTLPPKISKNKLSEASEQTKVKKRKSSDGQKVSSIASTQPTNSKKAKKRKSLETGSTTGECTPSVAAPVVVPESSNKKKSKLPKPLQDSKPKPSSRRPSLASSSSHGRAVKGKASPPLKIAVPSNKATSTGESQAPKTMTAPLKHGTQVDTIPGTPIETGTAKKSIVKEVSTVKKTEQDTNNASEVKKVSPDTGKKPAKKDSLSKPVPPRENKQNITQYLKPQQDKKSWKTSNGKPPLPNLTSPLPRKRSADARKLSFSLLLLRSFFY